MTVKVSDAAESESEWAKFVDEHPHSTFFHRFGWSRVLKQAFGHVPHFLIARRHGEVVGLVPLAQVKSALFGNRLLSLPFCVYGGILAVDSDAEAALRAAACDLADQLQVGSLEFRNSQLIDSGWPTKNLYVTFRKELHESHAANLKAIPNRQRAMLRKALKEGLYSEESDDVSRLYRIYAESVRNLGTPVFSEKYLHILREEFQHDCRVLIIRQANTGEALAGTDDTTLCEGVNPGAAMDATDVAAVLSFYHRGEVHPYYGGSISRARFIKGCNHFLYWELMRRSVDAGIRSFDFGRSKIESGPYQFKKNFGFDSTELHYQYYLVKDAAPPDLNPNNPKYQTLIGVWKRLPLPVANAVGPLVAKHLG